MNTFRQITTFIIAITSSLAISSSKAQSYNANTVKGKSSFQWPEGKEMALSLSFDDARLSQVDKGIPILDKYNVKATFYLVPNNMEQRLDGWKKAAKNGHDMGNHSILHPCTANFDWSRGTALEDYTLAKMYTELDSASKIIKKELGVEPTSFAYPCGMTFVGRGENIKSYIPVVGSLFESGRLWLSEGPNDPLYCDMSQLTGMESDGKTFEQIKQIIETAKTTGKWLILAGHEMNEGGNQTTLLPTLEAICKYAQDPANGIWIDNVHNIAAYVKAKKGEAPFASKMPDYKKSFNSAMAIHNKSTQAEIPELIVPVYAELKNMGLDIHLVTTKKAVCSIVAPAIYREASIILQTAIEKRTGVSVPIITDTDPRAVTPFTGNLIILGNRSTSKTSSELYDRYYSLMDLKYPGTKGYAVRTLHNPYGNGFSAVLVGGSDVAGVIAGAEAFAAKLAKMPASEGNLKIGWTMLTKLGKGLKVPTEIKKFATWEDSDGYGTLGYFGWNSISKHMAMYYMTGDPFQAREVIRLSFPDDKALKEIDEVDGERIEDKHDPLAGSYHYNAMMLILYWDLIEESPAFTDAERLKVTNAFARSIGHVGTPPCLKEAYQLDSIPTGVGSRHDQWTALTLYTLGRYFNKYYPSPMWAHAIRAGELQFAPLHNNAWVEGEHDNMYWYCTGTAPVLNYLILSGDRKPLGNGVLRQLLQAQEILISGRVPDWALYSAALDYLNKAAYLTGDGRWINYRKRTEMNTNDFRLGQSFWPDMSIKPSMPHDLAGKWVINAMPKEMWKSRGINFNLEQSFRNMSYRSTTDSTGDYILLHGYNGGLRNPYHTFDIMELRLNGATLLEGFGNQVLTSADGMVEPKVAMDGAILFSDVIGNVAAAVGEVPNSAFSDWRRYLAQRTGKYTLIADEISFRADSNSKGEDMHVNVETTWETQGAEWVPGFNYIKIHPKGGSIQNGYELHSSEITDVQVGKITHMVWRRNARDGEKHTFFHLLCRNAEGANDSLACLRLTDNAAVLALPESAVAVTGQYQNLQGDLVLMSEETLYGHAFRAAGLNQLLFASDVPVDADWDFESGKLSIVNNQPAKLSLALSSPNIAINGKTITGTKTNDLFVFNLPAGRQAITGARPNAALKKNLLGQFSILLQKAKQSRSQQLTQKTIKAKPTEPFLSPIIQAKIGGKPIESILIPSASGDQLCTATGKSVILFGQDGKELWKIATEGEVKVLRWWVEHKLLLVGCSDEKVIAFDERGQKKWEFTSVMDPAVYEAGKPYWFKSAYPGISELYSGIFDNGKSRAFVGSSCTLEILDENGQLVKRTPVFWGPGRKFQMITAADGSKNLLVSMWPNGYNGLATISSKKLEQISWGYLKVPEGHTYVDGWSAMNRYDQSLVDLYGDGKRELVSAINGFWNRITIYTEDGKPLYNAQIGPGVKNAPRANIRKMEVGDLDGDGKPEIIAGLSSGFVILFDGKMKKIWSKQLLSPPTVVKFVHKSGGACLCIGCEDGTVVIMDPSGKIIKQGTVIGRPEDLQILKTQQGTIAIVITDKGEVSRFKVS